MRAAGRCSVTIAIPPRRAVRSVSAMQSTVLRSATKSTLHVPGSWQSPHRVSGTLEEIGSVATARYFIAEQLIIDVSLGQSADCRERPRHHRVCADPPDGRRRAPRPRCSAHRPLRRPLFGATCQTPGRGTQCRKPSRPHREAWARSRSRSKRSRTRRDRGIDFPLAAVDRVCVQPMRERAFESRDPALVDALCGPAARELLPSGPFIAAAMGRDLHCQQSSVARRAYAFSGCDR